MKREKEIGYRPATGSSRKILKPMQQNLRMASERFKVRVKSLSEYCRPLLE